MKKVGFVGLVLMIFSTSVYAQYAQFQAGLQDGLFVQVRALSINPFRLDIHMADTYEYSILSERKESEPNDPAYLNVDDGIQYAPVVLFMPEQTNVSLNLILRKSWWGFEVRSWKYGASVDKGGTVTTPGVKRNKDGTTEVFVDGVRMWERNIRPDDDEAQASGLSPVLWGVENAFDIWTVKELFLIRLSKFFEVAFGRGKIGITNYQQLGQEHNIYIDNYYGYDLNGDLTYAQTASVNYQLKGPSLGLRAQSKHFELYIAQSILSGKVKNHGLWTKQTNGVWTFRDTQELYSTFRYGSSYPVKQKTRAAVIHTELSLRYYNYSFTIGKISIGYEIGLSVSRFTDTPVAPRFELVHGYNWHTRTENLIFAGVSAGLIFKL